MKHCGRCGYLLSGLIGAHCQHCRHELFAPAALPVWVRICAAIVVVGLASLGVALVKFFGSFLG